MRWSHWVLSMFHLLRQYFNRSKVWLFISMPYLKQTSRYNLSIFYNFVYMDLLVQLIVTQQFPLETPLAFMTRARPLLDILPCCKRTMPLITCNFDTAWFPCANLMLCDWATWCCDMCMRCKWCWYINRIMPSWGWKNKYSHFSKKNDIIHLFLDLVLV